MEIRPMGAELFLVDRHTHMTKLTITFHNFAKVHKNISILLQIQSTT
jgi:hypothetical protein